MVSISSLVACIAILCWTLSLSNGRLMKLVLLTDAPETHGAMCLDGSPPAFYFRPGIREGKSKWIVHLQTGGFCLDAVSCAARSQSFLGTTNGLQPRSSTRNAGILSDLRRVNPDFYNWNMVDVTYCDGAAYASYREEPVEVEGKTVYIRGFRILQAVFDALLNMGMKRATDVILTGCSADGLATFIHADYVRNLLPPGVKYAILPDSGIFPFIEEFSAGVEGIFNFHNMSGGVDVDCVAQLIPSNEEWKCYFAEFVLPHITSPIFAINSLHDTGSPLLILQLGDCLSPNGCDSGADFSEVLANLREEFLFASASLRSQNDTGYFFSSCLRHCQSIDDSWNHLLRVEGQLVRETFANWYFGRSDGESRVLDCEDYPCNDLCGNPRDVFGNELM